MFWECIHQISQTAKEPHFASFTLCTYIRKSCVFPPCVSLRFSLIVLLITPATCLCSSSCVKVSTERYLACKCVLLDDIAASVCATETQMKKDRQRKSDVWFSVSSIKEAHVCLQISAKWTGKWVFFKSCEHKGLFFVFYWANKWCYQQKRGSTGLVRFTPLKDINPDKRFSALVTMWETLCAKFTNAERLLRKWWTTDTSLCLNISVLCSSSWLGFSKLTNLELTGIKGSQC